MNRTKRDRDQRGSNPWLMVITHSGVNIRRQPICLNHRGEGRGAIRARSSPPGGTNASWFTNSRYVWPSSLTSAFRSSGGIHLRLFDLTDSILFYSFLFYSILHLPLCSASHSFLLFILSYGSLSLAGKPCVHVYISVYVYFYAVCVCRCDTIIINFFELSRVKLRIRIEVQIISFKEIP